MSDDRITETNSLGVTMVDTRIAPAVLAAIVAANAEIAEAGIAKDDKNQQQGFQFRGIDRVYDAVAGPLARNGLFSVPKVLSVERVERTSAKGGALFVVYLMVEYTFWCSTDGSSVATTVVAEAMDSGDKATAKAMSVAHRTALLQLSTAPVTPAEPDADTYEVAPAGAAPDPTLAGWESRAVAVEQHKELVATIAGLSDAAKQALSEWRAENGLTGWPLPLAAFQDLTTEVGSLVLADDLGMLGPEAATALQEPERADTPLEPVEAKSEPGKASERFCVCGHQIGAHGGMEGWVCRGEIFEDDGHGKAEIRACTCTEWTEATPDPDAVLCRECGDPVEAHKAKGCDDCSAR